MLSTDYGRGPATGIKLRFRGFKFYKEQAYNRSPIDYLEPAGDSIFCFPYTKTEVFVKTSCKWCLNGVHSIQVLTTNKVLLLVSNCKGEFL